MIPNWLDKTEYPFSSKYFDMGGVKLHYIDEGQGEILLFVHGTPSWSFDFRNVIKDLSKSFRCIAIDHIGFGLSDKPEKYDYSTLNHSRTIEKFIAEKRLENITLIVHDFGGPIALNFGINYPEKVTRIVILNSWLWSSKTDPEFIKLSKILRSPLLPFLYKNFNFSPKYLMRRSFGDNKLKSNLVKQYTKPFADKKQRNGTLSFAKSLLNDQDWFEELWNKTQAISSKPTLLVWGMKDPIVKANYLEKFQSAFVNSRILKLATSGHFPQEEQPMKVSDAIREFIATTVIKF